MLGPRGPNVDCPHSLRWPNIGIPHCMGQRKFARGINMRAPRRANVWSKVSSTLYMYPCLQNVFIRLKYIKYRTCVKCIYDDG